MATYKGNRGNLLQHWVLAELVTAVQRAFPRGRLCFVDAHAMSPYAVRDANPGQNANDFDRVRALLPGRSSAYEVAWEVLVRLLDCEYPSSAAFVRQLWVGPVHLLLCEFDRATANEIAQWIATVDQQITSWELYRGDWRIRFRQGMPKGHEVYLFSFDPYMFDRNGPPAQPRPGNMYVPDLRWVCQAVTELSGHPVVIQLSTYSANNANKQSDVVKALAPPLIEAGLSVSNIVVADGNMMSLVFSRDLTSLGGGNLSKRFSEWASAAAVA